MRAMIQTRYGPPSVLQLRDVEKPRPRSTQILVKIHATTVTAADYALRSGVPLMARLFTGLLKPSNPILGGELAGVVEAVGDEVTLADLLDPSLWHQAGGQCHDGAPTSRDPSQRTTFCP